MHHPRLKITRSLCLFLVAGLLSFILSGILSGNTYAQTPISKETANAYYNNCMLTPDKRMSKDTHMMLCSCTSVKMMETMTIEDIQVMAQQSQAGRDMLNKMLLNVYAPCMNFPVQDLVELECLQDKKIDMAGVKMDRSALCHCVAKKTGTWFSSTGTALMAKVIAKNRNITDPIGPVMDSPDFRRESYDNLISCLEEKS